MLKDESGDPAVAAFARWHKIEDEKPNEQQWADWVERSLAAEAAVAAAPAAGPAGWAAKLRLVRLAEGTRHAPAILDQVIAGLTTMTG